MCFCFINDNSLLVEVVVKDFGAQQLQLAPVCVLSLGFNVEPRADVTGAVEMCSQT